MDVTSILTSNLERFIRISFRVIDQPFGIPSGRFVVRSFDQDSVRGSCWKFGIVQYVDTLNADSYWELVSDEILVFTVVCWTVGVWVPVGVVIVVKCVARFECWVKGKRKNSIFLIFFCNSKAKITGQSQIHSGRL